MDVPAQFRQTAESNDVSSDREVWVYALQGLLAPHTRDANGLFLCASIQLASCSAESLVVSAGFFL